MSSERGRGHCARTPDPCNTVHQHPTTLHALKLQCHPNATAFSTEASRSSTLTVQMLAHHGRGLLRVRVGTHAPHQAAMDAGLAVRARADEVVGHAFKGRERPAEERAIELLHALGIGGVDLKNGWGAAQTSPLIDVRYQARPRSGRSCQQASPARSPLALQPGPV